MIHELQGVSQTAKLVAWDWEEVLVSGQFTVQTRLDIKPGHQLRALFAQRIRDYLVEDVQPFGANEWDKPPLEDGTPNYPIVVCQVEAVV